MCDVAQFLEQAIRFLLPSPKAPKGSVNRARVRSALAKRNNKKRERRRVEITAIAAGRLLWFGRKSELS